MPTAIELAAQFRQRLEAQEVDTAERMALAYNRIYTGLQDELKSLADEIAAMDKPDKSSLLELARLNRLLSQVEDELNKFGVTVTNEIELIQQRAITQASNDALALIEAAAPGISRDIILSFTKLPTNAIISAAGLVGDDSPLTARLTSAFGEYIAGQVRNGILTGVGIGKNPRDVYQILKRNFERSFGSGLTSALTTIRTAQIKSYQLASHASYQANSDIVTGWVWYSALQPGRTCMSCISKHGTVHPVTETLRDHHNGRCTPIPITRYSSTPIQSGQDWFKGQPKQTQRSMMGGSMYDAWKKEQFDFAELSRTYDDGVYGELFREASLKDILGAKAKEYYS